MKINKVELLAQKGVNIPNPDSVYISDDVNLDRISGQEVTLYGGTKIIGKRSLILPNVRIGYEAQVTLENTLVGENTHLNGGFFQDAVFAGDNVFGSGGHVRKGTILEEEANAAHTVGLKQTILFPFVTLGSLINFCDCLMAGGTSRKDHSEVGSSFIHFNYTPNQDKATPSMMGNVHQGVMLNQRPIFLGGQGGLVGPLRMGYGCITAAGSIIRKNELKNDRLILGGGFKNVSLSRRVGVYSQVDMIVNNNIAYIAGLISLQAWYHHVRPLFVHDYLSEELLLGMQKNLADCIDERIKRLKIFREKLIVSKEILLAGAGARADNTRANNVEANNAKANSAKANSAEPASPQLTDSKESPGIRLHNAAIEILKKAEDVFNRERSSDQMTLEGESIVRAVETEIAKRGQRYISVIQNLDSKEAATGSKWLYAIEEKITTDLGVCG